MRSRGLVQTSHVVIAPETSSTQECQHVTFEAANAHFRLNRRPGPCLWLGVARMIALTIYARQVLAGFSNFGWQYTRPQKVQWYCRFRNPARVVGNILARRYKEKCYTPIRFDANHNLNFHTIHTGETVFYCYVYVICLVGKQTKCARHVPRKRHNDEALPSHTSRPTTYGPSRKNAKIHIFSVSQPYICRV